MNIYPRDTLTEVEVDWHTPLSSIETHHGTHPSYLPPGTFSVVSGVRGEISGSARKDLGFRLWADLGMDGRFRNEVLNDAGGDDAQEYAGITSIEPFTILKRGAPTETVSGFALFTQGQEEQYGWIVSQVSGVHDPANPNGPIFHLMNIYAPSEAGGEDGSMETGESAEDRLLVSNGKWLYMFHGNSPHDCVWFEDSEFVVGAPADDDSWGGWRRDRFGVPPVSSDPAGTYLTAELTDINTSGGNMLEGGYKILAKLYDPERNRVTGLCDPDYYVAALNEYSNFINIEADNRWIEMSIVLGTLYRLGETNAQAKEFWTHYQIWATPSSMTAGMDPAEVYYYADMMEIDTDWDGDGAQTLTKCRLYHAVERLDSEDGTDTMPLTDSGVVGSGTVHDFMMDEFRVPERSYLLTNADTLNGVKAATYSQGLTMLALSTAGEGPVLIWSDLRSFRPENFPLANYYNLDYQDMGVCQFVTAGDYTFLFGNGPVYALSRSGEYLDVLPALQGFKPVSSRACTAVGNVIFGVFESGCWLIDATSANPTPMKALDRLVRDRWANSLLLSDVQVAYDAVLDCVFILCPGAAEVVALWLKDSRITMLNGANFKFIRELTTKDDSEAYTQRAMFITHYGKIVYAAREEDTTLDYTMHGLARGQWPDEPTKFTAKISATSEGSSNSWDWTMLTLVDADGNDYEFNPEMMDGVTVAFLTGPLRGQIWTTGLQGAYALYGDGAATTASSSVVDLSADAPDLTYVTSDMYLRVEGTEDGDITDDYYSIVSVDNGADTVTVNATITDTLTDKRWTIIIPGKRNTLRLLGHIDEHTSSVHGDLVGSWIAISPVPMTLIGAPLPGSSERLHYQRKHVKDVSAVISNLRGTDSDDFTNFALLRMGVCGTTAIRSTEPVAVPPGDHHLGGSGKENSIVGPGPLPRWLDLDDSTVTLVDVPAVGTTPSEDTPGNNWGYLEAPYGTSGTVLYPVVICDLSGVSFDLLEFNIGGTITQTEHDESEDT